MATFAYGDAPRDAMGYSDDEKKEDAHDAQDGEEDKKKKPKAPRAPRPKLTTEVLQGEGGFDDVFGKFPESFRSVFRGKGHEISDLQKLLELYARWQRRVFPHCQFDDFVARLEKLSGSNILKNELRNRRQKLIEVIEYDDDLDDVKALGDQEDADAGVDELAMGQDDDDDSDDENGIRMRAQGQGKRDGMKAAAAAYVDNADGAIDDDELLDMQAQDFDPAEDVLDDLEAGGGGRMAPPAWKQLTSAAPPSQGAGPPDEMDPDELLDMMQEEMPAGPCQAPVRPNSQAVTHRYSQQTAGATDDYGGEEDEDSDEELLRLMGEEDAAAAPSTQVIALVHGAEERVGTAPAASAQSTDDAGLTGKLAQTQQAGSQAAGRLSHGTQDRGRMSQGAAMADTVPVDEDAELLDLMDEDEEAPMVPTQKVVAAGARKGRAMIVSDDDDD